MKLFLSLHHCPDLWHFNFNPLGRKRFCFYISVLFSFIILLFITYETVLFWNTIKNADNKIEHKQVKTLEFIYEKTDLKDLSLNYGVVIDCGSSGSRIFVYYWPPHDSKSKDLLQIKHVIDANFNPVVMKISPGLSSLAEKPSEASEYLKPLLKYAEKYVPESKHRETPLYVLATAGLRMLTLKEQEAILDDIRVDIPLDFKFLFLNSHAEVITGKQEGIFAWISLNYILGKFQHSPSDDPLVTVELLDPIGRTHIRKRTVGILDMGGGSFQIAYEVPQTSKLLSNDNLPKSLMAEINLGCTDTDVHHIYKIYVTTYLGYGANTARKRYEKMLANQFIKSYRTIHNNTLFDPCMPVSYYQNWSYFNNSINLVGSGLFNKCVDMLKPLLKLDENCLKQPCGMNGTYQPEIAFRNSEFYGFSELYYTTDDILRISNRPFIFNDIVKSSSDYCSTSYEVLLNSFKRNLYPKADLQRLKLQCFKAAWLLAVIYDGLKFPKDFKNLKPVKYVRNNDVQWTLGALIYKTRFYPLRDTKKTFGNVKISTMRILNEYGHILIFVCVAIVFLSILLYLKRLRFVSRNAIPRTLSLARINSYA